MALLYKKYLTSAIESSDEDSNNDEDDVMVPATAAGAGIPVPAVDVGPPIQPGLPLNPMDPFYLTTCFVCGEMAKPHQEHIRNYGGVACFSCRAFFRRATHRQKKKKLLCFKGGACVITVETRQACKKCRYEKCLKSGMAPGAVLTDEQKQIRFRKLLSKRKRAEASEAVPAYPLPLPTPGPSNVAPVPNLPTVPSLPSVPNPPSTVSISPIGAARTPVHEVVAIKRIPPRVLLPADALPDLTTLDTNSKRALNLGPKVSIRLNYETS